MTPRPPVVTILGHVDHGKTSLLDYIRKSRLTEREHGQITQSIGAYEVSTGIKGYATDKITFIDTPGHEAFSKLRARGAEVADIALLIIDAKDSLKPQTIESISHIKAANMPFIVVLNKIDLPEANPEKVKIALMKHDVLVEAKGGKIPVVEISATTGKGVPELLETVLLLTSEQNLQYDPVNPTQALVVETKKDKRGVLVSIIIKDGTLKVGDTIFAQDKQAKVRAMINDLGKNITSASPSTPVELMGFDEMPEVGSIITTAKSELQQEKPAAQPQPILDLNTLLASGQKEKKLALIIKAESQGSLEAINFSLTKSDKIKIILEAVGAVHKSDVFLAKTTGSIVIGFNVKPDSETADLAKQEKVIIKTYNIIYELLEELTEVADLIREKEEQAKNLKGEAKVLATFIIDNEKVYGVKVVKGKANLSDQAEIYRDGKKLGATKLISLKVRAKPVPEVKKDQEAGMFFGQQFDIRVGDVVKFVL